MMGASVWTGRLAGAASFGVAVKPPARLFSTKPPARTRTPEPKSSKTLASDDTVVPKRSAAATPAVWR